jgi:hypothetical protein
VLFADKCGSSGGGTTTKTSSTGSTPRATPKPTPKPTPVPTPVRTMPPEPTDPIGAGFGRDERITGNRNGDGTSDGDLVIARPATTGSLRVAEPSTPPGLMDTIVGDVTGFFLGG